jgi:hypothetical protein
MFPQADYLNALFAQAYVCTTIPFAISENFGTPEARIGPWKVAALGAAMPKTSVYENGDFSIWKPEIRVPQDVFCVKHPSRNSGRNQRKA